MDYDYEPPGQDAMSGKKLVILFIIALIGAIVFIQVLFGFPFLDIFRRDITEDATVIIKNNNSCVVETSDHPRNIENCPYDKGDVVTVTYREGTQPITQHQKKP
jgi:hypothetical protein